MVVLVVRGRPYGAEQLVTLIFKKGAFATGMQLGDGGFATNKIATARISVVYNCQLY